MFITPGGLFAGCGGGDGSAPTPTERALSYFPATAPVVALVDTASDGPSAGALRVLGRLPGGSARVAALRALAARLGLAAGPRTAALLGNPIAVGAPSPAAAARGRFVAATVVRDEDALEDALAQAVALRPAGEQDGARLYRGPGAVVAADGTTVVAASTVADLRRALAVHARGGGLDAGRVAASLRGLGRGAVRIYGSAAAFVGATVPGARAVPWVRALRTFGLSVRASARAVAVDGRLRTDPRGLAPGDVPIAPGAAPPQVAAGTPLVGGLRDPAHTVRFALSALSLVDPNRAQRLDVGATGLALATGVGLDADVIGQFTESATLRIGPGGAVVRAQAADPDALAASLRKLGPYVPRILAEAGIAGATVRPAGQSGFSTVVVGGRSIGSFGVAQDSFVAGTTGPAGLIAALRAPLERLAGTRGAAAGTLDPRLAVEAVEFVLGGRFGDLRGVAGGLGAATAWAQASRTEVRFRLVAPLR